MPAPSLSASAGLGDLLGLLLTLLALVIAYKLAGPRPAVPIATLPPAACDLQRESCRLSLRDNAVVDLRIRDRPVVPNRSFVIEGSVDGSNIQLLEVEISGVSIDIGGTPTAFTTTENGYRAQANLPFCTSNRMTWQMTVLLMLDGHYLKWPLQFHTETVELHGPK